MFDYSMMDNANRIIEEGARKLKAREITANEFFVVDCNMAFSKDEIKKSAIDFVNDYFYFGTHKYGSYEEDYNNFIKNTLHKDENEIVRYYSASIIFSFKK